jgi:drug/metabolite transporter (DMT)-like permease
VELPSPAALFAMLMFGIIGFAAFRYGKKNGQLNPMLLGVGLMVYPYFISQTWVLYAIGCGLCAGLYFLRE